MIEFRAPGKLFWLGEYAVLDGHPAVVAAVDRYSRVTLEPGDGGVDFAIGAEVHPLWDESGRFVARDAAEIGPSTALVVAVAAEVAAAGLTPPTGTVRADSSDLAAGHKLGLGSSGSVCAGLVAAFAPSLGADDALHLALRAHRRFQGGRGSGADVVASCLGGLTVVQDGQPPTRLRPPPGLRVCALATGESADTRGLVDAYRFWRSTNSTAADRVAELGALAGAGVEALRSADLDAWLSTVRAYAAAQRIMTDEGVGIFTPAVDRCVGFADRFGWVAKPSGAGGGDIVLAFAGADADADRLAEAASDEGIEAMQLALASHGVLNDPGMPR